MSVSVETRGQGPDLALLHGWGMHRGIWSSVGDALASRFRLHLVDLPGYGDSPACRPYTLDSLAEALSARLPESVNVCGWSLGGQIALKWALRAPAQVDRLVLVASTPCFVRKRDWAHGIPAEVLGKFAEELQRDYEGTLKRFLSLQAGDAEPARSVVKQLRAQLFARGRPTTEVLQSGLAILLATDLRCEAGRIRQPVLLCHGERDQLTPHSASRWMSGTLPDARLHTFADAAHAPFLSHPRDFAEQVTNFLDEH